MSLSQLMSSLAFGGLCVSVTFYRIRHEPLTNQYCGSLNIPDFQFLHYVDLLVLFAYIVKPVETG